VDNHKVDYNIAYEDGVGNKDMGVGKHQDIGREFHLDLKSVELVDNKDSEVLSEVDEDKTVSVMVYEGHY
jgi:hypothetical protein